MNPSELDALRLKRDIQAMVDKQCPREDEFASFKPEPPRKTKPKGNYVWLEEYKCGCSFMAHFKKDLPGYCGRHGDDRKRKALLVPVPKDTQMGHV